MAVTPEQAAEQQRIQQLQQRQLEATRQAAAMYAQQPQQIQESLVQREAAARQQAARALAGSISAGGVGGGAALAGAADASTRLGEGLANIQSQGQQEMMQAQQNAQTAQIEALDREAEIGSPYSAKQDAKAAYKAKIKTIIEENTGFLGRVDDGTAAEEIRDLAAGETDPELRKWLYSEATRVLNEYV